LKRLDKETDLFIDPDTGIWGLNQVRPAAVRDRFVRTTELRELLPDGSNRLLLVYRQGREKKPTFRQHIPHYAHDIGKCWGLAFRGGGVTAAVFSKAQYRVNRIRHLLVATLGPVASHRVSVVIAS